MSRVLAAACLAVAMIASARTAAQEAPPIRPGGLVVHLGATDGTLELDLARSGTTLIHALTNDPKVVSDLRLLFTKRKVASLVSVELARSWKTLPYPDRFVQHLMADLDTLGSGPGLQEIERVLAVGGTARLRRNGAWRTVKRNDAGPVGAWTHKWYDPTGNPVSSDSIAGPPTAVQWVHGPAFADRAVGGKIPRIAEGVFVCVDSVDGSLFARDASTGLPLWRADLKLSDQADFVVTNGKVYVHVDEGADAKTRNRGEAGPLHVLDLATGKRLHVFEESIKNRAPKGQDKHSIAQTIVHDGSIVQAVGPDLSVLDAKTGKRRWLHTLKNGFYFAPILLDGQVIVAECDEPVKRARLDNSNSARALVAFDLAGGKQRWRTEKVLPPWVTEDIRGMKVTQRPSLSPLIGATVPPSPTGRGVGGEGIVFLHGGSYQSRAPGAFFAGVSAKDGKELWRHTFVEKDWTNTVESSRLVVRDSTLFYLGGKGIRAYDAKTGKPNTDFLKRPKYAFNGYGECSGSRATANWLISNALCYWDKDLELKETWAARSACGTGVIPANGMIYALPTGCDCASYSRGYLGLSCTPMPLPVVDADRLVLGPAAGKLPRPDASTADNWPIFLGNPQRTGATPRALPDKLRSLWQTKVTELPKGNIADDRRHSEYWLGALSAATVADDIVVVACPESGEVVALDAKSGGRKWSFPVGAKVDSPPTLHQGLALFGCHDGWVYAVRLSDGELAWRFLAAPVERKAMIHGHLSSAFPVHGSLLVLDGKLLVTAGFHNYLGGIHGSVLDPASGKLLAKSELRGGPDMPRPAVNDILCASPDNQQGWLALDVGLGVDGKPRGRKTKLGQPIVEGQLPTMILDRNAAFVRFPHDQRGGSTHGWTRPMSTATARGQRVVFDKDVSYSLIDPTMNQNHPVQAPNAVVLSAIKGSTWKDREDFWKTTAEHLGRKESYSALVKAGDRLYLGGGKRDSTNGFVQIISAADGKLLGEIPLPARVSECGLAVAGGRMFVSCEDGTVVCLGAP